MIRTKYLVAALCLSVMCFAGCKNEDDDVVRIRNEVEEPICGGVTDNTDHNAPKVINSDNLVKLSMGFYHEDKYDCSEGRYYTFVLEPDATGKVILKDGYAGEGFEVDKSVLDGAQAIIRKYDLARANGVSRITAGLPPQYEECDFRAEYDSGESIGFSQNSDPSAEWAREFIDYFAVILAEHGDDKYLTPAISGTITQFCLEVQKDNIYYTYIPEGEDRIYRSIYDLGKEEMLDETSVDSSPEYYDGILKIVSDMEIRDFENYDTASDFVSEGKTPSYYDFYIEYADGNIMSGASCDPEMLDKFEPMRMALMDYMDNYIDSKSDNN